MTFDADYPLKPPVCVFNPVLFHPNVFPTGHICLSLLYADQDWRSSLTVRDLLVGIQELLNDPNATHNAGPDAHRLYHADLAAYTARARAQAKANPPPDDDM